MDSKNNCGSRGTPKSTNNRTDRNRNRTIPQDNSRNMTPHHDIASNRTLPPDDSDNRTIPRDDSSISALSTRPSSERHLLIKSRTNKNLSDLPTDAIETAIKKVCGEPIQILNLSDGSIHVECKSMKQASRLALKLAKLAGRKVSVTPYEIFNRSCVGVVSNQILNGTSESKLSERLAPQNVIAVRRLKRKKDGEWVDSCNILLTFSTPEPPAEIKVAFLTLKIKPYAKQN